MVNPGRRTIENTLIREHNCVLRAVAEKFPEVCVAEERFLAEFLGAVVERRKHIASGASCCEYCVKEQGNGKREAGSEQTRADIDNVTTTAPK